MKNKILLSIFLLFFNSNVFANIAYDEPVIIRLPYSFLFYYSAMTHSILERSFTSGFTNARLYSLEPAYALPLFKAWEKMIEFDLALNFTWQVEPQNTIFELNPMVMLHWKYFPWNQWLLTTVGIGEGISYATNIPAIEMRKTHHDWGAPERLVNFLAFEATFSLPAYPQWELVGRIHHRSTAWGTYRAGNSSSNALGLGLRYLF
jgi:hypothetical protein